MPYLPKDRRDDLECYTANAERPGDLNFLLTNELLRYVRSRGLSYSTINDCLGALEGAKLEFYRRVAVPYESKKIVENGDIYPPT